MYMSGTTGRPKGVLHSHNTIDTEIQAISNFLDLDADDVILMPSPVSHITGYLYGIQMPFTLNAPAVFMERWNADAAGDLIDEHGVKIVDPADGRVLGPGEEGEILSHGPEMCLGYADGEHNAEAFDGDGYFRTGDLAIMSDDGTLAIAGRAKDLIIRGGENISPREIEDALHEHPAIHEAAVVAMPHKRMGEAGCAYVVLEHGGELDLPALVSFLDRTGMARQKYPERVEIIDEFPRTAAGKIRKNVLRDRIAEILASEASDRPIPPSTPG